MELGYVVHQIRLIRKSFVGQILTGAIFYESVVHV